MSQETSVEDSIRQHLLQQIPAIQAEKDHVTVDLEEERRVVCIGFKGNFEAFGVDSTGTISKKYKVSRSGPDVSFSFQPYLDAIQALLNRYVVRKDSKSSLSTRKKPIHRRVRKGTVKLQRAGLRQ